MADVDSYNEVLINGLPYKTRGPVPDTNLAVFPGKVTIGDYTQDSNPLLSSWVISDLTGGLGIEDMNEGTDVSRYKLGTLYTRYPNQISAPAIVETFATDALGHNAWAALGNIKDTGTGSWDLVYIKGSANFEVHSVINGFAGNLATSPVGQSVVYQGTSGVNRVVIPLGSSGVATYSSAAAFGQRTPGGTSSAGTPALQCACVWDNKLVGIDTSGQLWWTTNPLVSSDNWTSYGTTAKIPAVADTRSMTTYFDRQGSPAIFIVTDTDVWQFDPNGPELFTIDVSFPPHPYQGLAACKWGGDLYFSVGTGVHRYTGGSLSAVGLDRDHGLPIEYAGFIARGGLVPGYNSLFAFVTGPDLSGYTFAGAAPTSTSAVYEFTGVGWHMIWESTTETIIPNSMLVSRADDTGDTYCLMWGTRDTGTVSTIYKMNLPVGFFNPRQKARTTGGFGNSGWLITGTFDAGMKGYDKIANALDVTMAANFVDSFEIFYQIDDAISDDGTWTSLGLVTGGNATTYSLPFGTYANGIYPGKRFQRIRFKLVYTNLDSTNDPFVIESLVLSFVKKTPPSWSWTVELDLTTSHAGRSPDVMISELSALLDESVTFVPFVLREQTYRVFVAQLTGSLETGADESGFRRISLLEVPLTLTD